MINVTVVAPRWQTELLNAVFQTVRVSKRAYLFASRTSPVTFKVVGDRGPEFEQVASDTQEHVFVGFYTHSERSQNVLEDAQDAVQAIHEGLSPAQDEDFGPPVPWYLALFFILLGCGLTFLGLAVLFVRGS